MDNFGLGQDKNLLSRVVSLFTVVAEMKVNLQEEMANPQGMKVFAVESHDLPEDVVPFFTLHSVQSSPRVRTCS